ncbi:hypothetical protein VTO42DRAFT_1573 [Malbranchea cinnamomea]
MTDGSVKEMCDDCKTASVCLTARKRRLCQTCFVDFVQIKIARRMEKYRLRNAPKDRRRKLLLPLSYGVSSLSLLHFVNALLEKQRNTGRKVTAFNLHVLVVEPSSINTAFKADPGRITRLREAYPALTCSEVPFHSVFEYDEDIGSVMEQYAGNSFADDESKTNEERLRLLHSALTTPTSRADVDELLLRRLIASFAKSQGCEAILWGDSDTRLATRTLAHVAKGRGFSLPWTVSDGMSPWGIHFSFPLRDLFKSELEYYANFTVPELRSEIGVEHSTVGNMSSRVMSIDDLLTQYVETQGEKYPGVMANIVRTVDKLQTMPSDADLLCAFCGMPRNGKSNLEVQGLRSPGYDKNRPTCYGCTRTFLDIKPAMASS